MEKHEPGAAHDNNEDHVRFHEVQQQLESLLHNIYNDVKAGNDASAMGAQFYLTFSEYQAYYLLHIAEEENVTLPKLWQYLSDAELFAIRGAIIGRNGPEKTTMYAHYILPSSSHAERVELLKGIQANAPAPFFNALMGVAEHTLNGIELHALKAALGLATTSPN